MLLFTWLRRSAKKLSPREEGTALEFFMAPRMRILLGFVIVSLIAFSILIFVTSLSGGGDGWYAVFIPLIVLVAILLAMPKTVSLNAYGLRQHHWLRTDREITWNDVAWMRRGSNTGITYVKSKNGGRPVSFSPLLVGQSRFEHEVRAHARECDELDEE
jgi:hypothetical protein